MNTQLIRTTPEVEEALQTQSPVAIGVSGGKDSCAVAISLNDYLNTRQHTGPRILIHSDLGKVEWKDSGPTCERLSQFTGLPLVVVRRAAGGMMERWQQRWFNNKARYTNLECVKLILPWSTPSMRFCTSELKSAVIASELRKQFRGQNIISVTGIRADESKNRAKKPICDVNPRLQGASGTHGIDWHPIHHWTTQEVFDYLAHKGFTLHQAYREFHSSRVSCAFCIMSSGGDLRAAAGCADNHDIYREMCCLEIESTFSFQNNWLCDVNPELLDASWRNRIPEAKQAAELRVKLESKIPKHLHYTKGWPEVMPTVDEANDIAVIRKVIGGLLNIPVLYTDATAVRNRYSELMAEKLAA